MKTIQVVKRDDIKIYDDVYVTESRIPKLAVGEIYEIKGSASHDGIYLVSSTHNSGYASDVCKNCPFYRVQAPGSNIWPYCTMYRRFRSGKLHPICIADARSYWPRREIRKLSDIMESL